ncbi:MAG: ribose-phosphate diphosphokinase [Nitrososphaeria archaeon]
MSVKVVSGSNSRHIAFPLAKKLGAEYSFVEVKKFPDEETYIRINTEVKGNDVIYVNSLQPNPNEALTETLITIDAINEQGAKRVFAVIPYMSYARQDEMFNAGEAVSVFTVGKLFKALNVQAIYTVDMHLHRIKDPRVTFGSSLINLTGVRELSKYVRTHLNYKNRIVVGPDAEAEQWAKIMGEELGLPYVTLEKKRLSGSEVKISEKHLGLKEKDVIIVDDIISTGGTILEAVKLLRDEGANRIAVTCTHPILAGDAYSKLKELDLELLAGTDTVLSPISFVEVYPVFYEELKKVVG